MKAAFLAKQVRYSMVALTLTTFCAARALAQGGHEHVVTTQHESPDHNNRSSALIKIVRESTERFKDVSVAQAEGYVLQFGCVSGSDSGAMGLHFVNGDLVNAGVIDATRPQIVIYEPTRGTLRIRVRHSSWDSSFICSRLPIVSGFPPSTHYMCGRGRRIPTERS
jgi:hypothetical protein